MPMCRRQVSVLAAVLLLAVTGIAQEDRVDDFIKRQMEIQKISGLSVAVLREGKIVKAQGYGFANRSINLPVTAETVFRIGSISKQFIATGIMLLSRKASSVSRTRSANTLKEHRRRGAITIRHLLTHTSGMVREAPGFDPIKIQSDADVIRSAYPLPLRFAPGEKWEYGNPVTLRSPRLSAALPVGHGLSI